MEPSKRDPGSRALLSFAGVVAFLALVGDGWSGRPAGLTHQFLLLPILGVFAFLLWRTLTQRGDGGESARSRELWVLLSFQAAGLVLMLYGARHFRRFGYQLDPRAWILVALFSLGALAAGWQFRLRRWPLLVGAAGASISGTVLALRSFPLNYLRSDMLPVILWADTQWLHHVSPYVTMHVGNRLYDFPYLPGMLVVYLPFVWAGLDLRIGAATYLYGAVLLVWVACVPKGRSTAAVLLAILLLDPFLQYRHELYLQPHWFLLAVAMVCLSRGWVMAGCFAFGLSMGVYQFSWIAFPFVLLYLWRSRGVGTTLWGLGAGLTGMAVLVGPFLADFQAKIASNTVTQWGKVARPFADPLNLSYWVSFVIAPAHFLRLQAVVMVLLFLACVLQGRCRTLADTTRWVVVAVTLFILLNVIVDGYFYLLVEFLLLVHLCFAWGLLPEPGEGDCSSTALRYREHLRDLATGTGAEASLGMSGQSAGRG